MSQLLLYSYFRSSTSYRVRIAMNLKALNYEYKAIHLLKNGGEQHSAEYRKLNPAGEVPTLVHDGKVIGQSFAIIEYLDDIFPQNPLFPKDAFLKAKVRQFCEGINCGIHPLSNLKTTQVLDQKFKLNEQQRLEWNQHWIRIGLESLEKQIETTAGMYCFGDEITAADLFLIPQLFSANRFQVTIQDYPTLNRVNEKCLQIEAFQKAHPSLQPDFQN